MTTNNIEQAVRAAHEARLEAAAAARLESEGTLDGDEAIRRRDDFTRKSARVRVLEPEAARLIVERDGEHPKHPRGTPMTEQEIVMREIARLKGGE